MEPDLIIKILAILLGLFGPSVIFSFLAWNNSRSKLDIEMRNCYIDWQPTPYVCITITNIGGKNITLDGLYGYINRKEKLVIDKPSNIIAKTFHNKTLRPSEKSSCQLPYDFFKDILPNVKHLYVIDSANRKWFFSKKEVKIVKNKIKL